MISNDEFHRSITEQINNIYHNMNKLHNETMEDINSLKEDVNKLISQKQKIAIIFGIVPIAITIYTLFLNR